VIRTSSAILSSTDRRLSFTAAFLTFREAVTIRKRNSQQ
jgi:hypothetical protein